MYMYKNKLYSRILQYCIKSKPGTADFCISLITAESVTNGCTPSVCITSDVYCSRFHFFRLSCHRVKPVAIYTTNAS